MQHAIAPLANKKSRTIKEKQRCEKGLLDQVFGEIQMTTGKDFNGAPIICEGNG